MSRIDFHETCSSENVISMKREKMVVELHDILARSGFFISDPQTCRSQTFDIICRRDSTLLIFKILTNVDSFSSRNAQQLKLLSSMLNASPIVVGINTSTKPLKEGVIYLRHQISIVNMVTIYDMFLEGVYPSVFAAPGGLYVELDSARVRMARQQQGMSLGNLAKAAGISRRAIQMYESGMSSSLEVGLNIEEALGIPVIKQLDPLKFDSTLETRRKEIDDVDLQYRSARNKLQHLGYRVVPLFRCPFDAFTLDTDVLLLTGFPALDSTFVGKARLMKNIASITERESVFFVNESFDRKNIEGNPVISRNELDNMSSSLEILELLRERQ